MKLGIKLPPEVENGVAKKAQGATQWKYYPSAFPSALIQALPASMQYQQRKAAKAVAKQLFIAWGMGEADKQLDRATNAKQIRPWDIGEHPLLLKGKGGVIPIHQGDIPKKQRRHLHHRLAHAKHRVAGKTAHTFGEIGDHDGDDLHHRSRSDLLPFGHALHVAEEIHHTVAGAPNLLDGILPLGGKM